jgi:hypothetical protein
MQLLCNGTLLPNVIEVTCCRYEEALMGEASGSGMAGAGSAIAGAGGCSSSDGAGGSTGNAAAARSRSASAAALAPAPAIIADDVPIEQVNALTAEQGRAAARRRYRDRPRSARPGRRYPACRPAIAVSSNGKASLLGCREAFAFVRIG